MTITGHVVTFSVANVYFHARTISVMTVSSILTLTRVLADAEMNQELHSARKSHFETYLSDDDHHKDLRFWLDTNATLKTYILFTYISNAWTNH